MRKGRKSRIKKERDEVVDRFVRGWVGRGGGQSSKGRLMLLREEGVIEKMSWKWKESGIKLERGMKMERGKGESRGGKRM